MTEQERKRERNRLKQKKWAAKNKDKKKQQHYKWRKSIITVDGVDVSKGRLYTIRNAYGLSAEEYVSLYKKNSGKCHICDRELDLLAKQKTHIDHCHTTGRIRGMLCPQCNTKIAAVVDQIGTDKIVEYFS
jgi:hypothetical protein